MAEFFNSSGVNFMLDQIVSGAKDRLILVSPYLQINDRIRQMLTAQDRVRREIRLIYGKSQLNPVETEWLRSTSIRTFFCKNLHAKCYMNESEALITSMNLYEYSQVTNEEMGIYVRKDEDLDLYNKIYADVERLLLLSEPVRIDVQVIEKQVEQQVKPKPVAKTPATAEKSTGKKVPAATAHCIRCNTLIPFSMDRPLCDNHYKSWERYKNGDYEEKFCHSCGKERETSVNNPMCSDHDKPWFRKKK